MYPLWRAVVVVSIYCDGSSGAKGGKPGGWAWVIVRDETEVLAAAYGGSPSTTNNLMEMTAAIKGMEAAEELRRRHVIQPHEELELVSDSQYALYIANGKYTPSANLSLAKLAKATAYRVLTKTKWGVPFVRWVPGHCGVLWNERVDSLAGKGKREAVAARLQ
jgi:ribonuclease HI